jgi:hypothetical protein
VSLAFDRANPPGGTERRPTMTLRETNRLYGSWS